jgi:hypothetical protein
MNEEEKKPEGESEAGTETPKTGGFVSGNTVWDAAMFNRGFWVLPEFNPFLNNGGSVIPKKETDNLIAQDDMVQTPITLHFVKGFQPANNPLSLEDKYLAKKLREAIDEYSSAIYWNGLLPKIEENILQVEAKSSLLSIYDFYKAAYARIEPNSVAIVHISEALKLFRQTRAAKDTVWIRQRKSIWVLVDKKNLIPYVQVQITRWPIEGMYMLDRKALRQQLMDKLNNPNSPEGENEE